MGIKYLNSYLMEHCSKQSIKKTHLEQLRGKTLVVDTSIYLYKFLEKSALYENLYLMISVFRKYDIVPIFVFDGKPPPEKKELLMKRKNDKDAAEEKWNALKQNTAQNAETKSAEELITAEIELDRLKRRFIRVHGADISNAKRIMDAYGAFYVEAHGESDQLCAYLVKHRFAYACVSDDMDMFLYGCDRVLRHMSLVNHDAILYNTESIMADLNIDEISFRDILILSGTDYNTHDTVKLGDLFRIYYQLYCETEYSGQLAGFSEWAKRHMYVKVDTEKMEKIRAMFSVDEYIRQNRELLKTLLDSIPFQTKEIHMDLLKDVMREDGFLF